MKIELTGTGGADGIPGFFSNDRVSEHARKQGGKDARTRASALIDGTIRIDFGPDTFAQCQKLGIKPSDWQQIVFTHSHDDHFAPRELQYMFPPFLPMEAPRPTVFGNQVILDGICTAFDEAKNLKSQLIKSFQPTRVGEYELVPIRAYHKLDEDSLNLIFRGDRTFLYATDTGIYQDETWEFLTGFHVDAAVIECSEGFSPSDYWGHLSCNELITVVERLRKIGCFDDKTFICTTHHSHAGNATHEELEQFLNPRGIQVGFDGFIFEV